MIVFGTKCLQNALQQTIVLKQHFVAGKAENEELRFDCAGASGSRDEPSDNSSKLIKIKLRTNTPRKSASEFHFWWILFCTVDLRKVEKKKTELHRGFCFHFLFDDVRWCWGQPKQRSAARGPLPIKHQVLSAAKISHS